MLTRRRAVIGLGSAGLLAAIPGALAQSRLHPVLIEYPPIRIAIPEFLPAASADKETAAAITQVVTDNLKRSGQFMPLDSSAFVERITDFGKVPQFADWKPLNAWVLVTGQVAHQDDGRLQVQFRLWDVASGLQLTGEQYVGPADQWRRVAHMISDQIYTKMTGEPGYFDSRIMFVEPSGQPGRRAGRLVQMDQDGANPRSLTSGGAEAVAQPRFAQRGQTFCYTRFGQGDPTVWLSDLESGRQERIDGLPGPPLCTPRFSPDGKRLVMSLVQGDRANLFAMDLDSKRLSRLTDAPAIDTAPSYSPDGSQICFASDRAGRQQIYVMPADGGQAERISFGGGSYSTPVWSPRDDSIAFARHGGGQFAIGIMKTDGSGERMLTAGFRDDSPTFAPNGRVLVFIRDPGGGPSLYSIDVSGRNELKVPTPGYASDPAWSPLLT